MVNIPLDPYPNCVRKVDTIYLAMDISTAMKVATILEATFDLTNGPDDIHALAEAMRGDDEVGQMVPEVREYEAISILKLAR